MLTKLFDWVAGREPVASATGIAAVVTAGLGVAAAFGAPVTETQIAAIGALAAALAGWAARRVVTPVERAARRLEEDRGLRPAEEGSVPLALIILVVLALVLLAGLGFCGDALFEDEDEVNDLGVAVTQLAYHEEDCWGDECGGDDYSQDYSGRDRNRNRGRNRGAFSPGPFDRSPVDFRDNCISLDCSGRDEGRRDGRRQPRPPNA
jgi:hypothetical protein